MAFIWKQEAQILLQVKILGVTNWIKWREWIFLNDRSQKSIYVLQAT